MLPFEIFDLKHSFSNFDLSSNLKETPCTLKLIYTFDA